MDQSNENSFYILSNNITTFIVFRDLKFNQSDIIITPKSKKEFLTLVFDLEDLTKELDNAENSYKFEDIINNNVKNIDNKHINIVIKNSLVGKSNSCMNFQIKSTQFSNKTFFLTNLEKINNQ